MSIQIPYSLPPTGTANNADVQFEFDALVTLLNAGVYAPYDASYVTLSTNSDLTSERVLTGTSNQIVITDNGAGSTVVLSTPQNIHTAATPTFASLTLTATSNQCILGTTRTVTLTAPTPASTSRIVTIPDLSGDYSVVGTIGNQTIAGLKTFSSSVEISTTSNHLKLDTTQNLLIVQANAQATTTRTWSIPDISGNGTFVALEGAQTFSGVKTFSANPQVLFGADTTAQFTVYNTNNTSSAAAYLLLEVGGGSASDTAIIYAIDGANSWSNGIDNSDSDKFKISATSSLGTSDTLTITTAGLVTVPLGDFTLSRSSSGGSVINTIANTSNTASSNAELLVQVAGTSANDAFVNYSISGSTQWSEGVDNSASDAFVISQNASLGTNNVLSISTAGAVSIPLNDLSISRSSSAGTVTTTISNTSNTSSSNAELLIQVAGTSANDPFINFSISGGTQWSIGTDNSDSDNFKISNSSTVGTTDTLVCTSNNEVLQPLQPSFLVTDGTGATDQTGDGTAYTEAWPTEIFDQNADFSSNTFTAPVTGRYQLCVKLGVNGLLSTHTVRELAIVTSNREYRDESNYSLAQTRLNMGLAVIADMDSGDTATVRLTVSGSTKVVDVAANGQDNTFSGSLIN